MSNNLKYQWPPEFGVRSAPFMEGHSKCREWFIEGVVGISINPYPEGTSEHDSWCYGWEEGFRLIEIAGGIPEHCRSVVGLTDQGKLHFLDHIAKHGDPLMTEEAHLGALKTVINRQLSGHMVSRQPPWYWQANAPERSEGVCFAYDERHLILMCE
ncbi:TPA: hypothetical protein ACGJRU_005702 [Pseudomonas aeruginosa]|uniref:hypothetical protein n=1 Tax=Pseudomonas aeruginosa TaxID=287 RepID=UPI00129880B3|nr:hypothetical protein [Pseudomonas aeruginosa]MBZ3677555.1 hypothetical protein [Pseudomonas aeruginosa]MBZ3688550.1 hypothetical protein [Pseudomonas aeruginosa]